MAKSELSEEEKPEPSRVKSQCIYETKYSYELDDFFFIGKLHPIL
ncbi:hypothetical protein DSCA_53880 [Desulfosarcina alkanivorans]|uniref:Uncharacterized protein n=1 Tax=Desulfosarcina alkanivorans TaxID=571177 RepID=A0A5K7YS00_9BACT|nr:hypothetical protein DSCA_53880 [Desulfosarcina alkanivorans]